MEAVERDLPGTLLAQQFQDETVQELGASRLRRAPIRDKQARLLQAEMEEARSLQAGTKEARLSKVVREGACRPQDGQGSSAALGGDVRSSSAPGWGRGNMTALGCEA